MATTERLNLHQNVDDPTHFSVRWRRSDSTYGSRKFHAVSLAMALETAPEEAGLVAPSRTKEVELVDAFNETLAHTKRGEKSRHDWIYYVKRFIKWLAKHHGDAEHWHLLTRQIVREYLATFDGKSATMRRLALQPICQTSGYMHREYGLVNFAERLGIGAKLKNTPPLVYLEDVVAFLDYVREILPHLEIGVALQGLAGLQVQEVTPLTWDKVDLNHGLVEISGEVKNEYRNRVIPVARRVMEALDRTSLGQMQEAGKVHNIRGHVLVSKEGCDFVKWWKNYTKQILAALRRWNPKINWKTKDLRNCLPTFAVTQNLHNEVWEQYVGHAPKSVTARHYIPRLASASRGEANSLERQMAVFRFHVTDHLDRAIERIHEPQILNFFEPTTGKPPDEFKIEEGKS